MVPRRPVGVKGLKGTTVPSTRYILFGYPGTTPEYVGHTWVLGTSPGYAGRGRVDYPGVPVEYIPGILKYTRPGSKHTPAN